MIDKNIIVPECKRILELMNTITKKTTRRDIKEIANIVSATTREWLYADTTLRVQIEFLCISPIGDREHLLNMVDSVKDRLNELISDPSDIGRLNWVNLDEHKPIQRDMSGSMDEKVIKRFGYALFGNNHRNVSVSHVFTKSEDIKTQEALNAKYSQNLDDWL